MDLTKLYIFLLCHYSLAKFFLKKIFPNTYKIDNTSSVAQIPIILLTILILSVCIPVLILFYCYKRVVIAILKYRHNSKFISLITGCDLLTAFNDKDGTLVSIVMSIESKKTGEELFDEISKRAWDEFTAPYMDKKLRSVRKSFMGYLYFKEIDDLNPRDVLKCIHADKKEILEKELPEFLNYHCTVKSLPLKGTFNWDFSIVATPLKQNNGETRYLIILRMHHFIADGLIMYNLIRRITTTEEDGLLYGDTISSKLKTQQKARNISSNLKTLTTYSIPEPITDESKQKIKPKSKGHLSLFIESTNNYVPKLKEIKNQIPGVSFNALILTAYSASLAEYFKEFTPKNVKIPAKLELVAPVQINMGRFSKYFGGKRTTKLSNDFTFVSTDIPIIPEDKRDIPIENYMAERLETITRNFQDYNKTIDYMFNYTLTKTYFEVFTTKLASAFLKYTFYNILMSIFPGGPKLTVFQGDEVKNIFFIIPLKPNRIDINFFTLSYDDKFQFIQIIDENKFESIERMDDVLKGILKYIDILYEQTVKK